MYREVKMTISQVGEFCVCLCECTCVCGGVGLGGRGFYKELGQRSGLEEGSELLCTTEEGMTKNALELGWAGLL